jgi:hypothetical protein
VIPQACDWTGAFETSTSCTVGHVTPEFANSVLQNLFRSVETSGIAVVIGALSSPTMCAVNFGRWTTTSFFSPACFGDSAPLGDAVPGTVVVAGGAAAEELLAALAAEVVAELVALLLLLLLPQPASTATSADAAMRKVARRAPGMRADARDQTCCIWAPKRSEVGRCKP